MNIRIILFNLSFILKFFFKKFREQQLGLDTHKLISKLIVIVRALLIGGEFVYDASEQKIIGVFDINNNDKVF